MYPDKFADRHEILRRSSRVCPVFLHSQLLLTNHTHCSKQQIEQLTGSSPLSKRQLAYTFDTPFTILFEIHVSIFGHVANDMVNHGVDRHSARSGRMRVSIRRGSVAQDGFDKFEGVDLKASIEINQ